MRAVARQGTLPRGPSLVGQSSLTEPALLSGRLPICPKPPSILTPLTSPQRPPLRFCGDQWLGARKQKVVFMNDKQIAVKTLIELKAKLYAQADEAIRTGNPHDPWRTIRIQKRVDRDAAHIAFAINLLTVKM